MNPSPSINTLEMVRRIREANYERLKGASVAERLAFYNQTAQAPKQAPADGKP